MSLARIGARTALVAAGVVVSVALMAAPSWASSASPSLVWSPTTSSGIYNYGTLKAGESKEVTFTLENSGGKASGALTITPPGGSAFTTTDNCTGKSLGPGKSCAVTVKYAPTASGESDSATLTATGITASASITLEGKATNPKPSFTLVEKQRSALYPQFTESLIVVPRAGTIEYQVTLTNTGNVPFTVRELSNDAYLETATPVQFPASQLECTTSGSGALNPTESRQWLCSFGVPEQAANGELVIGVAAGASAKTEGEGGMVQMGSNGVRARVG